MSRKMEKPLSNARRATTELREMIFSGELVAGSNHLESELADRLGMSRTPVREAALTLEAQGLVEMRPRKGVRILPISADDMAEIYDVLTELECLAVQEAALALHDDARLAALKDAIDAMETAIAHVDLESWAKADDRFHEELVRLGRNSRAERIVAMMSDQVRRARLTTLFMRPLPTKSNADHHRVYDAIRNGDPETAVRIHRAHRRHAKHMLVGLLKKYGLRFV